MDDRWMDMMRGILRRFQTLSVAGRLALGVLVAGIAGAAWSTGYKIYEHHATAGIGFYYADEIAIDGEITVVEKKKMFFDFMRPVAIAENMRIQALRDKIINARESGESPGWLAELADSYDVEWTGSEWKRLLMRVDTVPVTLILAQSANESNWGQSKFAQAGNNMFGQWCFRKGCGIVPARRDAGKKHEVAAYRSVNDSVRAYLNNINRTRAYAALRTMRWKARQTGQAASGADLAGGLLSYSERREEYVREIRGMIHANKALMLGNGQ